jgi:GH15 family glucan-1,4-alpha-glucosidase
MTRTDGYAAIEDYALVGDGRTAALVARDGSIDWLCLPDFDSPSVFGRLLDADRGGAFTLAPLGPFDSERSYVEGTNVLTTTFSTSTGSVRVTDAMTLADPVSLAPLRQLVRKVDGLSGRVELDWRIEPRFDYGRSRGTIGRRAGRFVATHRKRALGVDVWGGDAHADRDGTVGGRITVEAGDAALLALTAAYCDPLVFDTRGNAERRLERTIDFWRSWSERATYEGPWRELVVRSALVLKLLVYAPSAAIVASPTASLPEWIGGERNWDYRYSWVRDAAFTLVALLRLGYHDEASSFLWWLEHATALTQPEIRALYRLTGSTDLSESKLPHLDGYRGSKPVRVGNAAAGQLQLDVYGAMFDALWRHVCEAGHLSAHDGKAIAKIADWVAENWRREDHGIWESRDAVAHYTHSKAMCWVALDRACKLAERGILPDRESRWSKEAEAIRAFAEERLWDDEQSTYTRASDTSELDGALLLLSVFEYLDPRDPRLLGTIDAVQRELREGVLVRRYRSEDGLGSIEGAFLPCSFWLVAALAKAGRRDEAVELMEGLAELANDVGLYAEELAPDGSFLGNFPQALTHLALVAAALALEETA